MQPRVLTALPVYNEEKHLVEVLSHVKQFSTDILVVDDGSSDGTSEILKSIDGIQVIRHAVNQGYGAGLRSAFNYALEHKFDVLVTIDCDGQHQPQMIPDLAAAIYEGTEEPWDIISGSRYLELFDDNSIPPEERRKVNVTITNQLNDCLGLKLTDSFCGFKAYRVDALSVFDITELGYAMPLQLWVQAVRHRLRIKEFPVPLIYLDEERSFGGSLDDSVRRLQYYQLVLKREMEAQHVECGDNPARGTQE
ncbi:glycosyltransferase family 2 protein [Planctomicrobium sp. SH668]|uniref:glycosyltransferase family 2 protein n=1 Tax=Planctomicrobium sp. SH668 TaxID=3448126 RepID=UPI003F5C3D5C